MYSYYRYPQGVSRGVYHGYNVSEIRKEAHVRIKLTTLIPFNLMFFVVPFRNRQLGEVKNSKITFDTRDQASKKPLGGVVETRIQQPTNTNSIVFHCQFSITSSSGRDVSIKRGVIEKERVTSHALL